MSFPSCAPMLLAILLSGCVVTPPPREEPSTGALLLGAAFATTEVLTRDARMASALRQRAAYELGCPPDDIEINAVGAGAYVARGCDGHATLVCSPAPPDFGQPTCVTER